MTRTQKPVPEIATLGTYTQGGSQGREKAPIHSAQVAGGKRDPNPLASTMPRAWLGHSIWPQLSADGWGQPPQDSPSSGPSEQLSKWPVRAQGPGAPSKGFANPTCLGVNCDPPTRGCHPMPTCALVSSQPPSPHGPTSPTTMRLTTQSL